MSIFKEKERTERTVKKLTLQLRMERKKRRAALNNKWQKISGSKFIFLEPESSLAVKLYARKTSAFRKPKEDVSTIPEARILLQQFSRFLSTVDIVYGFCFAYDWETTGAFIINVRRIENNLSDLMFMFDDELKFYSYDFANAFELSGDRTGTWDKLNALCVGVSGCVWTEMWKNRHQTR